MEIKKRKKVVEFFKRFGVYIGAVVLVLALTITGLVVGLTANKTAVPDNEVDVSTQPLAFGLPMTAPDILKDFSNTELQENVTLGQWEAHFSMDLTSQDGQVYSVLDGEVIDVGYSYDMGNTVKIQHADGFVSEYSSLADSLLVSLHDKVTAGQKLGAVADSATNESADGAHLHFTLSQNNKKVNPHAYMDFGKK